MFLISKFVIVTKFVMITSSFGIIIRERKRENKRSFPLKSSLAKANAESTTTTSIMPVVTTVKTIVLKKYFASGTAVNAVT